MVAQFTTMQNLVWIGGTKNITHLQSVLLNMEM